MEITDLWPCQAIPTGEQTPLFVICLHITPVLPSGHELAGQHQIRASNSHKITAIKVVSSFT